MVEDALACLRLGRDFGQPDGRLGRLDLAEERADAAELVMPPVLEQARRLGRDLPLALGQFAPLVYVLRTSLMIEVGSYCCLAVDSP